MPRKKFNIATSVANLVAYAKKSLYADQYDLIYAENQLLALFGISEPTEPDDPIPQLQEGILDPILEYAVKEKLCKKEESLLFETKLMGIVMPSPSKVIADFDAIASHDGIKKATDYLNDLSDKSNYLRRVDLDKNIKWTAPGDHGDLVVTINLSKPEKDNKQVALERSLPQTNYPKCKLCLQNVGYVGALNYPPRQTLRTIPIFLNDEQWHFQFSPYEYYSNHCIAFANEHRPMLVSPSSFTRLLDFVDLFPHYFIGSNADLPIVGGSILSHDHYQGGNKVLPMLTREARKSFAAPAFPNVNIAILDWYNSVVRLSSNNRSELEKLASYVLYNWRNYSDESIGIFAKTNEQHNTVTPVATYSEDTGYNLYLILRNNRTDETHPYGIFHPTEDMHNIKKEGIGLIEAMGIFILPGRLFNETRAIVDLLTGATPLNFAELSNADNPLSKHVGMIAQLANDLGQNLSAEQAEQAVVGYINSTCVKILNCTAVFKNTPEGSRAFESFLKKLGMREI